MKRFTIATCVALMLAFAGDGAVAAPIRSLPGLVSIDIVEQTGGTFTHNYAPNASALTTRLSDPLGSSNNDFLGTGIEFYDVYYSDSNGAFDIDGAFITVDARFDYPGDSGLNLNGVRLNFTGSDELANIVTHYIGNGPFFFPSDIGKAADASLSTWTSMGNTDADVPRLSVTVGFRSSAPVAGGVPEPLTLSLFGAGLAGLVSLRRKRR